MSDFIYQITDGTDLTMLSAQIFSFQIPEWAIFPLFVIKIIAAIFSIAAFVAVVWLIVRLNRLMLSSVIQTVTASFNAESLPTDKLTKQWLKIKNRIDQNTEAEWKLGVIEADKLADSILKRMGYPGDSVGDRLKAVRPEQLESLGILLEAHKLRDTIIEDPEFYASELEIKNAIDHYETFLREVQAID